MGRHSGVVAPLNTAVAVGAPAGPASLPRPASRSRGALFAFAFLASAAFILVNIVDPYSGATASPYFKVAGRFNGEKVQALSVDGDFEATIVRDGYTVTPKPTPVPAAPAEAPGSAGWAPPAGVPDPGSAKAIGLEMVTARGWSIEEYNCLVALWDRESHWNVYAHNGGSGAYGIPQALPGSKMASAGADWETNPATQIAWGLGYVEGRYGGACGAWAHSEDHGWY